MIGRIWHGWTAPENADAYETLLKSEIFTGIQNRKIDGYRGIQLFSRELAHEAEFVTIMWFDSLDAVRSFAGEDYEVGRRATQGARPAGSFRPALAALRGQSRDDGLNNKKTWRMRLQVVFVTSGSNSGRALPFSS